MGKNAELKEKKLCKNYSDKGKKTFSIGTAQRCGKHRRGGLFGAFEPAMHRVGTLIKINCRIGGNNVREKN
jgi:hypothetical protein